MATLIETGVDIVKFRAKKKGNRPETGSQTRGEVNLRNGGVRKEKSVQEFVPEERPAGEFCGL